MPFFEEKPWKQQEWNNLIAQTEGKSNYILTGDLNAKPDGTLITGLSEKLVNAGPPMDELTFTTKPFDLHGFKVDGLEYRIDYVFTSQDVNVLSCQILRTDISDHLPLLLEIEI